jgi:rhodanese-related sulfurtransferase
MSVKVRYLLSVLLLAVLVLGACGGGEDPAATAEPPAAAPLAAEATATPEAAVVEATEEATAEAIEAATEAATEAAEEATAEAAAAEGGVAVAVDTFVTGIPEGYMTTGKLDDVKAAIDSGVFLVDVREPSEFAEGHIEGAVNIPLRTVTQSLDMIPSDQPVLVYCASGLRAGTATAALRMLGYDNVKSFPGGWKAWSEAGEAVSTDAVEAQTFEPKEVDAELLAAVDGFLSSIPEGFYSVGAVDKLQEAIDNGAVLVDVREESEFADGAVPGAINIPIRTLTANLDQIPQDQPVVVYCASGHRAALANAVLHTLGYDNVRVFPAGYGAWEAAQGEAGDVPAEVSAAVNSDTDIVATVDAFLSALPDNFRSVGKLEDFKAAIDSAAPLLIDVREADEYAAGHVEGAINIPLRTLADNLDKVPADQPVIVYCASGLRAGTGTAALAMLGYDNVRSFPGGWKAWSEAGEAASTEAMEAAAVTPKEVDPQALAAVAEFLNNIPEGFLSVGDVEKMKAAVDAGAALIDVREPGEFEQGHIAGAVNIPLRTLAQSVEQIPSDQPVIVYCASGHRAAMANAALHVMGLDNVRVFPAGYGAWEAAGEPIE